MYSEGMNQKEEKMESGNGIYQEQKEQSVSKEGNRPNQQFSRSCSNLKKVILLRRFIKALDKVRKFNPREPRYLPVEPDSEARKSSIVASRYGKKKRHKSHIGCLIMDLDKLYAMQINPF
ncbi:pathogen-induced calmodulin-binding protein [Trifolium medium]|uniref:Pathogen-induced calmodulin-binding protein n=1 Tax=Trifolium medium TaxID=97028 RepID=A0A392NTA4_9FABA|nr:pathogen-induced calmodulin-binding protein [Trifolium medium]